MGKVIKPGLAFSVCHGVKLDSELILFSPGVIGPLSDEQERLCRKIIIENAEGGPKTVHSVDEALKVKISGIPDQYKHFVAVKLCAHLLDLAEDEGLVKHITDTWSFMDYCMAKLGYGVAERSISQELKEFIDKMFEKDEIKKKVMLIKKK